MSRCTRYTFNTWAQFRDENCGGGRGEAPGARERVMWLYWGVDVFEGVVCLDDTLFRAGIKEVC